MPELANQASENSHNKLSTVLTSKTLHSIPHHSSFLWEASEKPCWRWPECCGRGLSELG